MHSVFSKRFFLSVFLYLIINVLITSVALGQELRYENVEFKNGKVILKGVLTLPAEDKGNFPAIIIVHGSGPSTRENGEDLAVEWAHKGIAVLRYDKRNRQGIGPILHSKIYLKMPLRG